jgi:hypothetical protein
MTAWCAERPVRPHLHFHRTSTPHSVHLRATRRETADPASNTSSCTLCGKYQVRATTWETVDWIDLEQIYLLHKAFWFIFIDAYSPRYIIDCTLQNHRKERDGICSWPRVIAHHVQSRMRAYTPNANNDIPIPDYFFPQNEKTKNHRTRELIMPSTTPMSLPSSSTTPRR